jgi:hypothetical protein
MYFLSSFYHFIRTKKIVLLLKMSSYSRYSIVTQSKKRVMSNYSFLDYSLSTNYSLSPNTD